MLGQLLPLPETGIFSSFWSQLPFTATSSSPPPIQQQQPQQQQHLDLSDLDLDSPVAWLQPGSKFALLDNHDNDNSQEDEGDSILALRPPSLRQLSNDNNDDSILTDADGNSYQSYSLAWRYLGMYMDCYDDDANNDDDDNSHSQDRERRLSGSNDQIANCARQVLWALYHDPDYSGNSIGEYQYYNHTTGLYDEQYCMNSEERCVKLDCHEPGTSFKLLGIYKETQGLEYFAEQLFKHQGVCLWGETKYEFMSTIRQYLPTECTQLYFPDPYTDQTLYMDVRPLKRGNIGMGIYTDNKCTQVSRHTSLQSYIEMFYELQDQANKGRKVAKAWTKSLKKWNDYMNIYKSCQPCRAYDLFGPQKNQNSHSHDDRDRQRQRQLNEDGEGDEEQWGYDCYDDAGYTNCNQCYKFETQTTLVEASVADLQQASRQGTILEVRALNGKKYGRGRIRRRILPQWALILIFSTSIVFGLALSIWLARKFFQSPLFFTMVEWLRQKWHSLRERFRGQRELSTPWKDHFHIEADSAFYSNHDYHGQEKSKSAGSSFTRNQRYEDTVPLSYVYE